MRAALPWLAAFAALAWATAWAGQPDWASQLRAWQLSSMGLALLVTAAALAGRTSASRAWPWVFWGAAAMARLHLALHAPPFSGDIFRYVWDAQVWRAGINPFRYAPSDPHLAFLRTSAIYPHINYPEIPTIYPLVDQCLFLLAGWIAPGVTGLKALLASLDMALVLVVTRELRRRNLPAAWALLVAFHPLALTETSANGHADVLGALLLTLGLQSVGEKPLRGALAIAGAVLAKWNAVVVVVVLRLPARAWVALGASVALGAAAFARPDVNPFLSLGQYLVRWRWNDSIFLAIRQMTPGLVSAKIVAAILLAAWLFLVARREKDPLLGARSALGALMLLSPAIHPWYPLWILPLAALAPEPGWLWLMGAMPLAYGPWPHRLADSQAELGLALKALEFGPAFAWWTWAAWRRAQAAHA